MNRVNLNQLYYFFVVSKAGSIKKASERLHLTQPTLSIQIRKLEADLGFPLFARSHRKLTLTPQGQAVLKRAEKIFLLADELINHLPLMGDRVREEFRIGALNSLSNSFINDFSMDLWADPSILPTITCGDRGTIQRLLEVGALDFALSDEVLGDRREFRSIFLGEDKLVAVAGRRLRSAAKGFPRSLNGLPYLSFPKDAHTQGAINHFFSRQNIQPRFVGIVDDISLMRTLTIQGVGFSVLPQRAASDAIGRGELVELGSLAETKLAIWGIISQQSANRSLIKRILSKYFRRGSRVSWSPVRLK